MHELLGVLLLLSLVWLHFRAVEKSFLKLYYFPALGLKLVAGVAVGLLYTYYYSGGDTWAYFNQAKLFADVGFASYSKFVNLFLKSNYELVDGFAYINQPRAALMVKLVAIINLLSNSSYWITSLYFSFFSFIGIYKFSNWVAAKFEYGKIAALALFVWPSFIFWSSGILKEALAIGLIFWIIPTFFEMQKSMSVKKFIAIFLGLYFLFLIKYYFAMVLIVILLLYSVSIAIKLDKKSPIQQIALWLLMGVIGFAFGRLLHPNLRFENIIGVIIENNAAFLLKSNEVSSIHFLSANTEWVWVIINAPKAFFSSLFLPLNLFTKNFLQVTVAMENWVLLLLAVRGLLMVNKQKLKSNYMLVISAISYVVILAIFLALSTPNLGTLTRYKVAFIPVVIVLVTLANRLRFEKEKQ